MSAHRHSPPGQHEHEFEAAPGLPAPLPAGEQLLWQGAPSFGALAVHAYHVRKVALYFAVLLAWRGLDVWHAGASPTEAMLAVIWLLPLALLALGLLLALAWLSARTSLYTITNRRVVMRIGIVLTLSFNLPLRSLAAAGLRADAAGHGDIFLRLAPGNQIAWLHLWPHTRPWRLARPEPALRGLADARHAASILSSAWAQANGTPDLATAPAPSEAGWVGRFDPVAS